MSSVKDLLRGDVVDGSGTANYVSKWSDADTITNSSIQDDGSTVSVGGNLAVDTNTLFVDAANNRVGINESSPDTPLKIVGNGNADVNVLTIGNFEQDDSGDETANIKFELTRSYTNTLNPAGYIKVGKEVSWTSSGDRKSFMSFYTRNGTSDPSEAMRIDASGNVGIGTSSPSTALGGATGIVVYATQDSQIKLQNSASGQGNTDGVLLSIASNGDGYLWNYDSKNFVFGTNNAERMRILSSGNVLINRTLANGTDGVFQVDQNTSADGDAVASFRAGSNTTTSANHLIHFRLLSGSGSGMIVANGASTAAFATFSDRSLKENITNLPNQLDNIDALRPVEFDYKDGSGHQIGFIAQELELIYPESVSGEDGNKTIVGWDKTTAILVKAIQELKAEIELLKSQK